jgi:hypothetical protein
VKPLQIQFRRANNFSSDLIGWFGADKWSHVDYVLPDGTLLGARWDKVGGQPSGVHVRPRDYDKERVAEKWTVQKIVEDDKEQKFRELALQQVGKPYDWEAIVSFAINRDWRQDTSWFCSELITWLLETSEIIPPLFLTPNKITPGACALICCGAGLEPVIV